MTDDRRCPTCGGGCSPPARFCDQCGTRLADAPEAGLRAAQVTERRQLTVMFCDLVGSTKLSLELDVEDFTAVISAYRDACARVVRSRRGYIARYIGDGVLVYFGYPRAGSDDALRSVFAAWELVREVEALSLPLPTGESGRPALRARIALHTGVAVVGNVAGTETAENDGALGAAPNIAARLQGLCEPGEVIVSETTAALLPAGVPLQLLERIPERADYGSVRAYRLLGEPQQTTPQRGLVAGPLVGRQTTLQRLRGALSVPPGGPQPACWLCGEAGLGKSRIVQELLASPIGEGRVWIRLACGAYGQVSPLHPFREWLDVSSDVPADVATTPYERRKRTFANLHVRLLAHAPSVGIVVEDMHWADSTTLEFVAQLLSLATDRCPTLLLTSREPPPAAVAASEQLLVEALERLAPGDAAALAHSLAAARPLSAFELAEIVAHADGIPLHIEEFVRARGVQNLPADGIPITLRDSLMSVLDTLGAGRTVALCASVFGRRFEYRQLAALLPLIEGTLADALRALVEAQVLVRNGEGADASFEFRHVLLRDTAYHTMLKSERARWHRRVAELAAAGTLAVEHSMPEVLAIHHSLGGSSRAAIEYWMRAHDLALQRSAHTEALVHVRRALEDCHQLAAKDPEGARRLELELLRRLTVPLIAIAGWSTPELEHAYARAAELGPASLRDDASFEIERGRYNMHLLRGDLRTADAIADRLLAVARAEAGAERRESLLLVALRSKALPAFYGSDHSAARPLLEEVLELFDPQRHAGHTQRYGTQPAMLALSYLGWMDAAQGRAEHAAALTGQALQCARGEGHQFSIGYALCFAASCAQMSGDVEETVRHAREALQLSNQHNFQYWLAWAQAVLGWVDGLQNPARGLIQIEAARRSYAAIGARLVDPYFEALAAAVVRSAGRDDAEALEAGLQRRAEVSGVWFWRAALGRPPPTRLDGHH